MNNIIYSFYQYFSLFLIYSFIGWLIEVIGSLITSHKLVNRGFLIGPIVPIWGCGAILITLIIKPTDSIFSLIIASAFICSFLEYIVNYVMEKMFKARWWDYSHLPLNFNGRIWLGSSLFFGVGGLLIIKYINPFFLNLISSIDINIFYIICNVLLIFVLIDFFVSCNIIKNLKLSVSSLRKDYTEEITKKVKDVLVEKSKDFNRLFKAFPDVNFSFKSKK